MPKSKSTSNNKNVFWITAAAVLLLGGGVYAFLSRAPAPTAAPDKVAKFMAGDKFADLTDAQKKPYIDAFNGLDRDARRKAIDDAKLTDDQRGQVFETVMASRMDQTVDGYFQQQSVADKNAYLDKQLKEMKARAATRPTTRRSQTTNPTTNPNGNRWGGGGGDQSARQRSRAESVPPAKQAARAEYFAALRARAAATGVEMRGGPGGGGMRGGR